MYATQDPAPVYGDQTELYPEPMVIEPQAVVPELAEPQQPAMPEENTETVVIQPLVESGAVTPKLEEVPLQPLVAEPIAPLPDPAAPAAPATALVPEPSTAAQTQPAAAVPTPTQAPATPAVPTPAAAAATTTPVAATPPTAPAATPTASTPAATPPTLAMLNPVPVVAPQPPPPPPPPPPFEPLTTFAPLSPAVSALALAASKSNNTEAATTTIERAIRIEPRNATLYYKLALLRLKQSKPRLAEDLAKKAAILAAKDAGLKKHSWLLVARAREVQGDIKGGKEARAKAEKF